MSVDVKVYAVASKLHGAEYYEQLLKKYEEGFRELGVNVDGLLTSVEEARSTEASELKVLVFLTGGTSRIAYEAGLRTRGPVLLLAHGEHNSLPSALSCRARLSRANAKVKLLYGEPGSVEPVAPYLRAWKAWSSVRTARVALLMAEEKTPEARWFEECTGAKVVPVPPSRVLEEYRATSPEEARRLAAERLGLTQPDEGLVNALRVYIAFKKLVEEVGANAITLDCFGFLVEQKVTPCVALALLNDDGIPAACEEDYHSLAAMIIAKELSGKPGWMANPSAVDGYSLVLAHCTIAFTLTRKWFLTSHFESGYPYAVAGELPTDTFTMFRLGYGYDAVWYDKGKAVASGMISKDRCRTQVHIVLKKGVQRFLEEALGNHHVLVQGDYTKELEALQWILGKG